MTLQATLPMTMAEIEAEFAAPVGTPLSEFVRGGTWVPDTDVNAGVPLTVPIAMSQLLGAANIQEVTIVMTAAAGPTGRDGFELNDYGSVLPTDLFGEPILSIFTRSDGSIDIELDSVQAQDFWTSVIISGQDFSDIQLLSTLAGFANPGGGTRWQFDEADIPGTQNFVPAQAYNCVFRDADTLPVFDMTAGTDVDFSGFNFGPGPDYGLLTPSYFKDKFVVASRFEVSAGTDTFKVALLGTNLGQAFFTRVTVVGDGWNEDLLTASADIYDPVEQGVQTVWEWNLDGHAVFTDAASYVVTLFE